jgi:hypothetical protein
MSAAIFRCDMAALASPRIFPMSTSVRCFHGFRVGGIVGERWVCEIWGPDCFDFGPFHVPDTVVSLYM